MRRLSLALMIAMTLPTVSAVAEIAVPADQPTLQAAVNAANTTDTILVSAGVYSGAGNWDVNPAGKNLAFVSVDGPHAAIIDCGAGSGLVHSAFVIGSGAGETLTLDGLLIRESASSAVFVDSVTLTMRHCRFEPASGERWSPLQAGSSDVTLVGCEFDSTYGSVYISFSTATIDSCIFSNGNNPINAGTLKLQRVSAGTISNSLFTDNEAYQGAAIQASQCSLQIVNTTFENNNGENGHGGALSVLESSLEMYDCTLTNNHGLDGGGVSLTYSELKAVRCIFDGNTSDRVAGAIVLFDGFLELDRCTIIRSGGSGSFNVPGAQIGLGELTSGDSSRGYIHNSIIAYTDSARAVYCEGDTGEVDMNEWIVWECSDVYGNGGGDYIGQLAATYSDYDCLNTAPLFADTAAGNLSLSCASPLLATASPCGQLIGALGATGCEGCCSGSTGNVNGDGADQTNITDLTYLVDFLFRGAAAPPCGEEADVNGEGGVNVSDLTYLVDFLFRGGTGPVACP